MTGTAMRRAAVRSCLALTAATAVMLLFRARLDQAHIALVLLLVVLDGSAIGGRRVGITLAAASFLVFNWFFLPPYGTFVIADPLDWLVLAAFLLTSIVAAQLLARAQDQARAAEARSHEIDRVARLGAAALAAPTADDAVAAMERAIGDALGVAECVILRPSAARDGGVADWVLGHRTAAAELADGTVRLDRDDAPGAGPLPADGVAVRAIHVPLVAHGRPVGVLRMASPQAFTLDVDGRRLLEAFVPYAGLAMDRAALAVEAERARGLREADRLKDALLATVSHDLRTPLTTIRGLAHELRSYGDERALVIEAEAERLNRTVDDLLDVARLNAGVLPLRIAVEPVDELLAALAERFDGRAGVQLEMALPGGEVLASRFDLVHTLRALANLVENAARHAPGSPILVTVAATATEIAIAVADRGPGVAPEREARLFEPFQERGGQPDVGGAGLGLSIARRIAQAQGGDVTYAARPGGGSTFTLRLPRTVVDPATDAS